MVLRAGDITHDNCCMWIVLAAWLPFWRLASQLVDQ